MKRQSRTRLSVLLALLAGLMLSGCRQVAPVKPVTQTPAELLPVAERQAVVEFSGEELQSGDSLSFPLEIADGRIAIYNFFSPG